MTRETAERLSQLMLAMSKGLDASLTMVQEREGEAIFKEYRQTVATLMGTMFDEVMSRVYGHYPDLAPEELRPALQLPDKARPFAATHLLHVPGEEPFEVMLYGATSGVAHTRSRWNALHAGICIHRPLWQRTDAGAWLRDGQRVADVREEPLGGQS